MELKPPCLVDMKEDEYRADPCETPSLSASIAKVLVAETPLHAWLAHPRLGGQKRAATAAMEKGTLVHAMLLGTGPDVAIIEADDYKTKAAQAARDIARLEGRIPMLAREVEPLEVMAACVREQLRDLGIELCGASEVTAIWQDESSLGEVVLCRGRMDHVILDQGLIIDLKTARSVDDEALKKATWEHGYDIQWAAYTSALERIYPDLAGRVRMRFVFIESDYPHCVRVADPDGETRHMGSARWERALDSWIFCLSQGTERKHWPGYPAEASLGIPGWILAREEYESAARSQQKPREKYAAAMGAFEP